MKRRCDADGVLDELSAHVMRNQVAIATTRMAMLDRLTPAQRPAPITARDLFGAEDAAEPRPTSHRRY